MRFTDTVLMSWAEKNWNSTPLMADATGSEGFMVNGWRALRSRPVLYNSQRRNATDGNGKVAGGDNFSKLENMAKALVKVPAVHLHGSASPQVGPFTFMLSATATPPRARAVADTTAHPPRASPAISALPPGRAFPVDI